MKNEQLKCGNCIWFESAVTTSLYGAPVEKGQCKAIDNHTVTVVFGTKKCKQLYEKIKE